MEVLKKLVQLMTLLGISYAVVVPQTREVILPMDNTALNRTPEAHAFICGVTETNVIDFNSTWITPSGERIEAFGNTRSDSDNDRLTVQNVGLSTPVSSLYYVSTLTVRKLSFKDDGNFLCSINYTLSGSESMVQSGSTSINCQLIVEVLATINTTTGTEGGTVTLHCQMLRYLRPDSDFLWMHDNQTISEDSRHKIIYRDQMSNGGQLGERTSSRGSFLTISKLQLSDAGIYTCFVRGTDSSAEISMMVNPGSIMPSPDSTNDPAGGDSSSSIPTRLASHPPLGSGSTLAPEISMALFYGFGVVGIILLLALTAIGILTVCYLLKKRTRKRRNIPEPGYMPTIIVNTAAPTTTTTTTTTNNTDTRRPSYTKVDKKRAPNEDSYSPPPPLPPPPRLSDSPKPHHAQARPQEIVAYDFEISKTFMPYAPPPPVQGLAGNDKHTFTESQNPYNIPMESLADYDEVDAFEISPNVSPWKAAANSKPRNHSLQNEREFYYHNRQKKLSLPNQEVYYDTVESVRGEVMELTGSLRSNTTNRSTSAMNDGHYQSPRRNPAQLSRNNSHCSDAGINIYTEHLEPSMIHRPSESSDDSETALPYGPVYATPKTLHRPSKPLEISYNNISEIRSLGVSRFGDVVLAATVDLSLKDLQLGDSNDKSRSFLVAVKKLRLTADWELRSAFQEEIKCMMRMKHANVVRLLGVCSLGTPRFSVVEYMENGDLHEFLRKLKLVPDDTAHLQDEEATPLILLYMAVQIASGMRYLASRKFIHRDLATRNCLVGREFIVKISEFGMSRSLYNSYYFRIQGQLILPIRWMAYESFYGKFSTKSDVWSFGVTLWEIFSMAEQDPYSELNDEEVIDNATKGPNRLLLSKPEVCPDDIFEVMKRCWVHEPSMRADFEEIYSRLFLSYISKSQQATT